MDFLISGTHINPINLIVIGFIIGICGGFFGVGGSFLAGPALFTFGVPMNFVVGTDLAHIVGKSIVAAKKHRALGNVDIKLGLIMATTTILGVETGAQIIQNLKRHKSVDLVVAIAFVIVLVGISIFIAWESWQTLKMGKKEPTPASQPKGKPKQDHLVYILGVPTHVAVGTDLFEVVISASYGTLSHAIKGNVDILIALVMHTGAAIGAQIGATLTQYFHGVRIRLAFVPLPLLGAGLIIYSLMTGHHFK